jgi:molybdopterin molybdotransferase
MITFEQFVRPALLRMQGARRLHRPLVRARVSETLRKKPGRMHLVRVTLERDGETVIAHSTGNQSSGVLKSMIRAQGS